MTAIQKENIFMVRFLVAHGGSKQSVDVKGNSVYHYAAISNWDIIDVSGNELKLYLFSTTVHTD